MNVKYKSISAVQVSEEETMPRELHVTCLEENNFQKIKVNACNSIWLSCKMKQWNCCEIFLLSLRRSQEPGGEVV